MNIEFLRSLGIETTDLTEALTKLGQKEFELAENRDFALQKGATDKVAELEEQIKQIKAEREQIRKEIREQGAAAPAQPDEKEARREESAKRRAIYEKLKQDVSRAKEAAQNDQGGQDGTAQVSGSIFGAKNGANAQTAAGSASPAAAKSGSSAGAGAQQGGNASNAQTAAPQQAMNSHKWQTTNSSKQTQEINAGSAQVSGGGGQVAAAAGGNGGQQGANAAGNAKPSAKQPSTGQASKKKKDEGYKISIETVGGATNPDFVAAMDLYFHKMDYDKAFQSFMKVAEIKKPADDKELECVRVACYILSCMYLEGKGTKKDQAREHHYLKRAADMGLENAQLDYGQLLLGTHLGGTPEDLKARKEGLHYVELAADAGHMPAVLEYIKQARQSTDMGRKVIKKAKAYISIAKEKMDSYDEAQSDAWLKELAEREKAERRKVLIPIEYLLGGLLLLIGMIYFVKGRHQISLEEWIPQVMRFLPDFPDVLIIKWAKLKEWTEPYFNHQGIFGCWLILIGNAFKVFRQDKVEGSVWENIWKVLFLATCVVYSSNYVFNLIAEDGIAGTGGFMQLLAPFGALLIGWLVGKIMKFIFK